MSVSLRALWGRSSWFGGPSDPQGTASGISTSVPGIATPNRDTLGGWWVIKAPNGSIGFVRQTDLGPASWTGRVFDYTFSLLPLFGYSQANFPTNGQTYGYYLGQNLTDILSATTASGKSLSQALVALGATPEQQLEFTGAIDAGSIMRGQTFVAPLKGPPQTSDPKGTGLGSEATNTNPIGAAGDALSSLTSGIGDFFAALLRPSTWLRVLYFIAGIAVAWLAARQLQAAAR